jgi:hypothetical protein
MSGVQFSLGDPGAVGEEDEVLKSAWRGGDAQYILEQCSDVFKMTVHIRIKDQRQTQDPCLWDKL